METLGQLSDYMADKGDQWWRDVPDIGDKKAETVADNMAGFWKAHPEYCGSTEPESAETRVNIKATRDIKNEDGEILLAVGETISALTDVDGVPYLIDPSDNERMYLAESDHEKDGG